VAESPSIQAQPETNPSADVAGAAAADASGAEVRAAGAPSTVARLFELESFSFGEPVWDGSKNPSITEVNCWAGESGELAELVRRELSFAATVDGMLPVKSIMDHRLRGVERQSDGQSRLVLIIGRLG
jgi:hypothetical protein